VLAQSQAERNGVVLVFPRQGVLRLLLPRSSKPIWRIWPPPTIAS
jgi:hypothetical protein